MKKFAIKSAISENRITVRFRELRKSGNKALIGYLTAGDPDFISSERDIRCAFDEGLDILELGVPFSDPIADGPVIQAASQRALQAGATIARILNLVEKLREKYRNPIVLFGYANPFLVYGYQRLCRDAAEAGVDGILVVDLSSRETDEIRRTIKQYGLLLIPLIAPTTSQKRARSLLRNAEGFVYYIMVKGVTGAREQIDPDMKIQIERIKECTDLPVVAGFGISNGSQARKVAEWADGVVVGSAMIKAAGERRLGSFVRQIRQTLDKVWPTQSP